MIAASTSPSSGRDQQQALGVGLGRGDLQQRDKLAGAGQPVLHQAVMGQFCQLLDPDAGRAQHFHDGERPERVLLLLAQVAALAAGRVVGPDLARRSPLDRGADQRLPGGGELTARPGLSGCFQQFGGLPPALGDGGGQHRQDGEPFPGPGVHPGLAAPHVLAPADLLAADRAGSHPGTPAGRIFDSPVGQVKVEGPDRGQAVTVVDRGTLTSCDVPSAPRTVLVTVRSRCFHAVAAPSGRRRLPMPG